MEYKSSSWGNGSIKDLDIGAGYTAIYSDKNQVAI